MGDANVTTSEWRTVQVGRVVLFSQGPYTGKLATIVEIIDHKRILVDGPSAETDSIVPRHATPLAHVSLTPIVVDKFPRAAGHNAVKAAWQKAEVEKKWNESAWAKSRASSTRRRALTDFERFKVMRLRKQARFEVRKTLAAARASAKA
ncbi:hypothetical protein K461DRAFT_318340 [Myriangium duriaei CBS 260.36]|uniref:KOW domain-containing protein n=1 Tax=Myriangium duriaei CBS 260.36 TaxID=1168546 RepID=A0A9P4MI64_9PEZI|nr:hypothetical protein K461DRAFT_318340 [Myriangium duriaei CBS 260.36]